MSISTNNQANAASLVDEIRTLISEMERTVRAGKAISADNVAHLNAIHNAVHDLHDSLVPLFTAADYPHPTERSASTSTTKRSSYWGSAPK